MKRTLILSAIAATFAAFSIAYFFYVRPNRIEQNILAQETEIKKDAAANLIAAPGVIEAVSEEIEVGAEINGKLRQVLVEEGEEVVKGQTLAVLENADFETAIRTAKAQIETLRSARATANARLFQAETERQRIANGARTEERREAQAGFDQTLPDIENARREYERRRRLFDSGDVSREELERAKNIYENAQKQSDTMRAKFNVVNAAARVDDLAKADAAISFVSSQIREFDAQIAEAEARVREAEARLEKTIIRAPRAGVILRKRLKDGESVSPENSTGIVTVADVSALRVRVDLDEADVARIAENQTAFITADAYGERRFAAKVVKIGRVLGRKNFNTERPTEKVDTKILEILLELDRGQILPLGLRVDAFINTGG